MPKIQCSRDSKQSLWRKGPYRWSVPATQDLLLPIFPEHFEGRHCWPLETPWRGRKVAEWTACTEFQSRGSGRCQTDRRRGRWEWVYKLPMRRLDDSEQVKTKCPSLPRLTVCFPADIWHLKVQHISVFLFVKGFWTPAGSRATWVGIDTPWVCVYRAENDVF